MTSFLRKIAHFSGRGASLVLGEKKFQKPLVHKLCELRMRFLFRVTGHSAFVRISINTSQGFPYSAHNLLETRQFRPQLGEFFRLFREVILVATNPIRQIAEFFVWHFGMALFRPRSGRSSRVLLVPNPSSNCHTE